MARIIEIKPIESHQISDAKHVILTVGRELYQWKESIAEIQKRFEQNGEFADMDDFQTNYFANHGLFLVVTDHDQVVGTGAIRRLDENVCELKRLWLLEPYQGQGLGYRVLQRLIKFAEEQGYQKIVLETDHEQARALQFYQQVGFQSAVKYNDRNSDVYLEMAI